MSERPSLRDVLADLAGEVNAVDVSDRVATSRRRLRRQRAMTATLAAVAVLGAGGFAWQQASPGAGVSPGLPVGGASAHTTVSSAGTPSTTGRFAYTPLPSLAPSTATPSARSSAPVAPSSVTSVEAAPAPMTPAETVPSGHGCSSPWTDESSGQGSPFASSAQREKAAAMGTRLCSYLGRATVTRMVEWISMRGLNGTGVGVTYDLQATVKGAAVFLEIYRDPDSSHSTGPVVTSVGDALRARWPDGTVVFLTKGDGTKVDRTLVADPAFDAFRS